MKGMTLLLLGTVLTFVAGTTLARVATTKDRFTGETTVAMDASTRFPNDLYLSMTITIDPAKPIASQNAKILFQAIGARYQGCFATHWLADDQPVETPDAEYHGKTGQDELATHMDIVRQTVPMSTILKLADAQSVEFEICRDEFKLDPADIRQLKDVVKRVEAAISAP